MSSQPHYDEPHKSRLKYSFCEPASASSISPWCIRPLTDKGRKLGGGVDTQSLCGRVQERFGWDLNTPVSVDDSRACKKCIEIFQENEL